MTREIWIRVRERREIAVMEDGHLVTYLPEEREGAAEAVYLGRVERVVPGMQAAFVNIGQEKAGFLPLKEHAGRDMPPLQSGQHILVQVRKVAQGVKGAFLTRCISLCGEYVILSPLSDRISVSSRIGKESDRRRMKALAQSIVGTAGGIVMRTAALSAEEEAVRAEAAQLLAEWQDIRRRAPTAHAPSVIHVPRTLLDAVLDDYRPRGIDRILTNDAALAEQLQPIAPVLIMGDGLFETGRISNQLQRGLERRVWLESGGNLVFDPCEAMTVIDVNTAKYTGESALEDTVLQLNLEACAEIARQVRLRNLSGIIIIDMIDMRVPEHRQQVLRELERCFGADCVKTVVHGFTSLGLVEMTRRRARPPLREMLDTPNEGETENG
ncbi:MAG: ribonuclease E/G [Aristaeellaceae bacterium]